MNAYLEENKYINYHHPSVQELVQHLKEDSSDEISYIQNAYECVRDRFPHSWAVQDSRVSISASDVIENGVGICWVVNS